MKKIFLLITTFTILSTSLFGQEDTIVETKVNDINAERQEYDMTGLVISLSAFDYFACGIGFNSGAYSTFSGHFFAFTYGALVEYKTISEMHIRPYIRVYGGSAGLLLGLSGAYATDFDHHSFGISPEIGIGLAQINILYRYNFYLLKEFNCHEIALIIYIF